MTSAKRKKASRELPRKAGNDDRIAFVGVDSASVAVDIGPRRSVADDARATREPGSCALLVVESRFCEVSPAVLVAGGPRRTVRTAYARGDRTARGDVCHGGDSFASCCCGGIYADDTPHGAVVLAAAVSLG